ncbi:leucyl aminopeptidase [Ureaplasma ceti]|uniref:Probable cytosol aminopeptidase n=1 Tax=Ureaplasma ceti TaxID=3119530 RepID=A0ABP9UCP0_9BACT
MLINGEIKQNYVLKAVSKNHNIAEFEDETSAYSIFNHEMKSYNIVMEEKLNGDEFFRAVSEFIAKQSKHAFAIDLDSFTSVVAKEDWNSLVSILVSAVEYGSVTPWSADTNCKAKPQHNVLIKDEKLAKLAEEALVVAEDRTFARKLQDMPSNLMVPGKFVEEMKEHFAGIKNVTIKVLERKELEEKGLNLLVGVGQAANVEADQPRLMIVEYHGNPEDQSQNLGFVGKGVCFDTGGSNVKPGPHMRWMKYDMSGAAIVGSTIHALAKNEVKVNAVAVMPLVLNLMDSNAQRPDDVVVSYNGISVEIDNTDAEGRLILADAITYAIRDLKVSQVVDVATLTGAMIYCLGETYTGVWASTEELWSESATAAQEAGELIWRLPFHHDFKDLLKSKYANIANSVSDIRGGSSRAAMFLKEFTEDMPYGHFDIAGTGDKGHTGTGVMVSTFYNMAKNK